MRESRACCVFVPGRRVSVAGRWSCMRAEPLARTHMGEPVWLGVCEVAGNVLGSERCNVAFHS